MRKRRLFLVAGACAAALSLTVGSVAFADPVPPSPTRPHPGVGSNTTEEVMNGFANGVGFSVPPFPGGIVNGDGQRTLASWNSLGSTLILYKDAPPECQSINNRPNDSNSGVNALRGLAPGNFPHPQCLDWARSSTDTSASRPEQNLRFIPFAVDGLTFATLATSVVAKNLSVAQLNSIYKLNVGQPLCDNNAANGEFKPVLPKSGSGTRSSWLSFIGVTETQIGTCVNSTQPPPEEHDCSSLTDPRELVPFGVAQYIIQTQQPAIDNRSGRCDLRAIDGVNSMEPNAGHPGLTFATLDTTVVPRNLTLMQLKMIYGPGNNHLCDGILNNGELYPRIPPLGSATGAAWLSLLGLGGIGGCVQVVPDEHDCRTLTHPRELVPFGVAQYIGQTQQPSIANSTGGCDIRGIDGIYSTEINSAHRGSRQVYNVLKNEDIGSPAKPDLNAAFVGAGSQVCMHPEVIRAYGFKPIPPNDPRPCGS